MRFSLQDVKRQVRRREGGLAVMLHFLRPGELRAEIERLIAFHEQRCGQPRKSFAQDEASALVGDYRLAHCLLATLSTWYAWQQPSWADALRGLGDEAFAALDMASIHSPVLLRLAFFDYVNLHYGGFLSTEVRPAALEAFAALYALDVAQLTALLALDSENEALLTRLSVVPDAEAVAALYNQWVFEAALFNASEVRFQIDCEAFLDVQRAETTGAVTGIGAVIKRLCYLARKLGVYYDLAYEEAPPGTSLLLHLTLYGPQEMTGSPQQYGQRLARLCRLLLGYGTSSGSRRQGKLALSKAIRRAEASVYIFQQAHHLSIDAALLALLPAPEPEPTTRIAESATVYDSGVEQSFAEAFASLARDKGTAGWQLEREPEPLLFSTGAHETVARGILIPDFALTRESRRIYVEILGFWTPAYRERKVQKLQQLKGHTDLVLAFPVEARQAFVALAADYPLVEYRDQLSATELLRVVQERYDDFAERLDSLDVERARASVRDASLVSEHLCYPLLNCYRRSELARAVARVLVPGEIAYTPGTGLYLCAWLEHLHRSFVKWVEGQGESELPLSAVLLECRAKWPELAGCEDTAIETLLGLWPEVEVQRTSIFEATLAVTALRDPAIEQAEGPAPVNVRPVGRKVARERRADGKGHPRQENSQQNLWE